jgi:hypothetical protein
MKRLQWLIVLSIIMIFLSANSAIAQAKIIRLKMMNPPGVGYEINIFWHENDDSFPRPQVVVDGIVQEWDESGGGSSKISVSESAQIVDITYPEGYEGHTSSETADWQVRDSGRQLIRTETSTSLYLPLVVR